jgi:hypothetical protein
MRTNLARRGMFAAAVLTISGIAATSGHAAADDGGTSGDAGQLDAALDAGSPLGDASLDATVPPFDATVPSDAEQGTAEGGGDDAAAAAEFLASDAGPVQDDGSLPVYTGGNIFQALCLQDPAVADPTAKPFAFDTVTASYNSPADCLKYNDEGQPGLHSCYCNQCFSLMQQCDSLEGCREILKCALANLSACQDPSTCYFTACTTVIDKWANTSTNSFLPFELLTCGNAVNNCGATQTQ